MNNSESQTAIEYIASQVKERDYGRYIACLYGPAEKNAAAIALSALHLELRQIREKLTEPPLQAIRYQWWGDAIEEALGGSPKAQPLLQLFAAVSDTVSVEEVISLISARQHEEPQNFDLEVAIAQSVAPHKAFLNALAQLYCPDNADELAQACDLGGEIVGLSQLWLGLAGEYHSDKAATRVRAEIAKHMEAVGQHHAKSLDDWTGISKSHGKPARMLFLPLWDMMSSLPVDPEEMPDHLKPVSELKWHMRALQVVLGKSI